MDFFRLKNLDWPVLYAEPYRWFFPLGLLCAVVGTGVWIPHYFWPGFFPYPGQGHAAIQIQGFLFCFILGFQCTMLPKILGLAPLGGRQFALFIIGLTGAALAALFGAIGLSQFLHLFLILNFLAFILTRLPKRRADPPPFFLFIALAMLADLTGTVLRILVLTGRMDPPASRVEILLQYQAFPLLLILGVGSFLLPKWIGNGLINPKILPLRTGTSLNILVFWGSVFLLSYGVESALVYPLSVRLGYGMRAAAWLWFLFFCLRMPRLSLKPHAYLIGSQVSPYVIGAGLMMPVFLPAYRLAWEHLVFVTGYLWLTLSIATRVMAAHGGRLDILDKHRKQTLGYGFLLILAAITRVSTDVWTGAHGAHLALAAGFSLCALLLWARICLPLLLPLPRTAQNRR